MLFITCTSLSFGVLAVYRLLKFGKDVPKCQRCGIENMRNKEICEICNARTGGGVAGRSSDERASVIELL